MRKVLVLVQDENGDEIAKQELSLPNHQIQIDLKWAETKIGKLRIPPTELQQFDSGV